jgi:hypothetical protein
MEPKQLCASGPLLDHSTTLIIHDLFFGFARNFCALSSHLVAPDEFKVVARKDNDFYLGGYLIEQAGQF